MRKALASLAATTMLAAGQVLAGALAPAPQIVATYDRGFIERSGAQTFGEMLDTGIIRYFFTGGRDLLIMVNGRPYATTAHNLDTLPLSAVERIEVLRAESLGTLGGHAAVRGAFNLVLRKDLDGFDVRTVARMPSRDGGDARQGSVVWGGAIGTGGHMTVGVDILDRQEIVGSTREHSRSEWTEGGSFADAKNVSVGGNTVYIFDTSAGALRSVALGECDPADGYTGPLGNPPGIDSGDKGCGYPFGNDWWDSASYDQRNAILSLDHPLGERAALHVDANVTHGRSAFRYAPSVDVFSITPSKGLLDAINEKAREADPAFEATGGGHLRGRAPLHRPWLPGLEDEHRGVRPLGKRRGPARRGPRLRRPRQRLEARRLGVGRYLRGRRDHQGGDRGRKVRPDRSAVDGIGPPEKRSRRAACARRRTSAGGIWARVSRSKAPVRVSVGRDMAWTAGVELEDWRPTAGWSSGQVTAGPAAWTGCSGRAAPATPAGAMPREPSPRCPCRWPTPWT